ncbi:peroxisomal succinyl-coenzyme A thioesterase-like isoform X1 [Electrophorus electricus]|uniref:peroxisomal succinyl-coenzyme A thioesterase-like isoform X1 n=1 Tax=Electrophorus electricus TaxID=8005 RepID=UPI0015D0960B|nr:peroxisomal succinyl-coenzyme A thioesterase-like isoform X1 [Electrophorus electricus]
MWEIQGRLGRLVKMLTIKRLLSTVVRACPLLSIKPTRGLVDEKLQIVVRNLRPKQDVTLHSVHQSEDKDFWEAFGHYVSDGNGTVTVAKDASLSGTYVGVEAMGLMWSLRPVPGSRTGLRFRKKDVLSPLVFHISVHDGHVSQGFTQLTPLESLVIERWYMAPGVRRFDIRERGVRGTLFIPPGPGPFPGVLDMWGGGGGLVEYRAALLASHGFASMALEYLTPGELKKLKADVNYFETAYQILQNHDMVRRDRLALCGLSFGGCITLSMIVYSKIIQPQCCVCISGSHIPVIKKSLDETFEDIRKHINKIRIENNQHIWRDITLPVPTDPTLKVDVARVTCPVLLVVGGDDQNLPTLEASEDIQHIMEKAGNHHLLQVLIYPGAGHLIEPPYSPHHRATNFIVQEGKDKILLLWGGQAKPHADAQEDSWEKLLAFLQQHLYHATPQAEL